MAFLEVWVYSKLFQHFIKHLISILILFWCWERLKAGGEGDDRGWDGWMVKLTQWTWIWASSRSWTGKPGVLQSMGSQRVGHNWMTGLHWILFCLTSLDWFLLFFLNLCRMKGLFLGGILCVCFLPHHQVINSIQFWHCSHDDSIINLTG